MIDLQIIVEQYMSTSEDWYPCYPQQQVSVHYNGTLPEPLVCVDDTGMEYCAYDMYNKITNLTDVTRQALKLIGLNDA